MVVVDCSLWIDFFSGLLGVTPLAIGTEQYGATDRQLLSDRDFHPDVEHLGLEMARAAGEALAPRC